MQPDEIIRICHVCEGGIEISIQRITIWHHKACRVMTNGDRKGQIFLSHPHTFFFLLTIKYCIFIIKKRFQKVSEYAVMRHNIMLC